MTPEQAEDWVTTYRWGAHVGHGWTAKGEVFPFGMQPSRKQAIADVLAFAEKFGEPPATVEHADAASGGSTLENK